MTDKITIEVSIDELTELFSAVNARMEFNRDGLKDHDNVSNIFRPIFVKRLSLDTDILEEMDRCLTKQYFI